MKRFITLPPTFIVVVLVPPQTQRTQQVLIPIVVTSNIYLNILYTHILDNHLQLYILTNISALISSKLALHRLATGRQSRIATALTMLKQMLFKYVLHCTYFPSHCSDLSFHESITTHTLTSHCTLTTLQYITLIKDP